MPQLKKQRFVAPFSQTSCDNTHMSNSKGNPTPSKKGTAAQTPMSPVHLGRHVHTISPHTKQKIKQRFAYRIASISTRDTSPGIYVPFDLSQASCMSQTAGRVGQASCMSQTACRVGQASCMSQTAGRVGENDDGKGNGKRNEKTIAISDNKRYDEIDLELSSELADDYGELLKSNISNEVMNVESTETGIYNIAGDASNDLNSIEYEQANNVNRQGDTGSMIGNNTHTAKSGKTADNVPDETGNQVISGIDVLQAYVEAVKDSTRKKTKALQADIAIYFETEEPDQRSSMKKPKFGTKRKNVKNVTKVGDVWNGKATSTKTKPKIKENKLKTLKHCKTGKGSALKNDDFCLVGSAYNDPNRRRKDKVALEVVKQEVLSTMYKMHIEIQELQERRRKLHSNDGGETEVMSSKLTRNVKFIGLVQEE